ncbi:MAG: hypothetical protein J6D31_07640 [Clostridia bacterium]|nr:hypothetical protein [Clostridia bacterium]
MDESGLPLATLGDILITDAAGHTALGSLTVTETAAGIYTVIVHADRAFLTAPTTVYPVTVDPTIDETAYNPSTGSYEAAILDYGLYSSTVHPADKDQFHHLGNVSSGVGSGRIIYKFPHFIQNSLQPTYTDLNQYEIASVSLFVCGYTVAGYPNASITAYPITMSWSSTTNAFDSTPLYNSCKNGTPTEQSSIYFDNTYSTLLTRQKGDMLCVKYGNVSYS